MKISQIGFPMLTQDPFLFAVYHKDEYPAGNEKMEAPRRGNGSDFNPTAAYRMYHGDKIPGFPQHPHKGFETITCTIKGLIDHSDSLGCGGRYGNGDVQFMTAGKGIVHGEMFPLLKQDQKNSMLFFQLWLNLPKKSKLVKPAQKMIWAEDIKTYTSAPGVTAFVWAGELHGVKVSELNFFFNIKAPDPTKDSWAHDPENDVNIWFLRMDPSSSIALPPSKIGSSRSLYCVEGSGLTVDETAIPDNSIVTFNMSDSAKEVRVKNTGAKKIDLLVLQGKPIGEPVAQRGPFVMNTDQEIQESFAEYRRTQFGGWPWPQDAMAFPREKGRFLLVDGKETFPPKKDMKDEL